MFTGCDTVGNNANHAVADLVQFPLASLQLTDLIMNGSGKPWFWVLALLVGWLGP